MHGIKNYITQGLIAPSQIEISVKKILAAKYKYKAFDRKFLNASVVSAFVNRPEALAIKSKLIEAGITLVNDEFDQLPLRIKADNTWMGISIGSSPKNVFLSRLESYAVFALIILPKTSRLLIGIKS